MEKEKFHAFEAGDETNGSKDLGSASFREKVERGIFVVLARLLLLLGTTCRVVYFAASYRTLLMKEHWGCKSFSIG